MMDHGMGIVHCPEINCHVYRVAASSLLSPREELPIRARGHTIPIFHSYNIEKYQNMKLFTIVAASCLSKTTFAFTSSVHQNVRSATALNANVGIYYSTQTGNTETVAGYISEAAGVDIVDIGDAADDEITALDSIIVGAPTWHTDQEEERSGTEWDTWLYSTLPNIDVSGKNVAVFGVGDQASYAEYYCDAAGELYDLFEAAGCKMMGFTSTDGYDHDSSKAERDGKFIGLMCDEDNQDDMSEDRAKAWVEQLKGEGFF